MRLKMQGGGARQKAWDCLRKQPWDNISALSEHLGLRGTSLYPYIRALVEARYVERSEDGEIRMVRDTGPRAPSLSKAGVLHDWNLHPPMSGEKLRAIIAITGLSDSAWLSKHGIHARATTRLRSMIAGEIPISAAIEEAAEQGSAISSAPSDKPSPPPAERG